MEKTKLLSVVIPVRNREDVVMRTLESIEAQTSKEIKLIIVDNGSTDRTPQIISEWTKKITSDFEVEIINEPRAGASTARNRGLEAVDTPYVAFFDSDDEMRPMHVANILEAIRRYPEADIIRWDVSIIDPDGWMKTENRRFHDEMQLHLLHGTLSTVRYAVKTSLIREAGGWDETLSTWDDLELGVRLLLQSHNVKKINGEPCVAIHHSAESISGNSYSERAEQSEMTLDCIEQHLRTAGRTDDLFILDCRRTILAALYAKERNHDRGKCLLEVASKDKSFRQRMILSMVYNAVRFLGHGGAAISLQFGGKKQKKC